MTITVAIIGSSNASALASATNVATITPHADTRMKYIAGGGTWAAPTNSIAVFANELRRLMNEPVDVIVDAVPGGPLFQPPSGGWWLNKAAAPLTTFLPAISGVDLRAVWWVGGEADAVNGATKAGWLARMLELKAIASESAAKEPRALPMIVSALGPVRLLSGYSYSHYVAAAAYAVERYEGMHLGPELWDLPTYDTVHLDEAGRVSLALAGAARMAEVLMRYQRGVPQPVVTSFPVGTWGAPLSGFARNVGTSNGQHAGIRFVAPVNATLSSLKLSVASVASGGSFAARLHADASGSVGAQIGSTGAAVAVSAGTVTLPCATDQVVVGGLAYWLVAENSGALDCDVVTVVDQAAFRSGRHNTIASVTNGLPLLEDWQAEIA